MTYYDTFNLGKSYKYKIYNYILYGKNKRNKKSET